MFSPRTMPLAVLVVSALLGLVSGVVVVVHLHTRDSVDRSATETRGDEPEALRVLRAWDARRSRAYARGDVAALGDLYAPGSRTGAADRAVLRSYRERGLRVSGMRTQVLAASVVHGSARRVVLRVTDVLVDAVAGDGDQVRWALPRDRPSTRRVVLVRSHGEWRVAEAYVDD